MRHYDDFLTAYLEYARDGFCPDQFHFWAGVSIVAGSLERKVWIPFEKGRAIYPNLYIFMLSNPGVGKSSAGNRAVFEILKSVQSAPGTMNFIPAQITEAAFIQVMARWREFHVGERKLTQSAAYFYASEASNSLKEMVGGGDIIAALTDFYDCPTEWKKMTKGEGETAIFNVCFNLLAGCTFNYLNKLLPDENIAGGFASRVLYVVHDEVMIRRPVWPGAPEEADLRRQRLIEDLTQIHHMTGPFRATREFGKAYEDWFPEHDAYMQSLSSERMQAFLARKHTNILKLAQVCCASESDDMVLTKLHWDRALDLIMQVEAKLPKILDLASQRDTQGGINRLILQTLKAAGGALQVGDLRRRLIMRAVDARRIDESIEMMSKSGMLGLDVKGVKAEYRILVNADDYL